MSIEALATTSEPVDGATMDALMSDLIDSIGEEEAKELKVTEVKEGESFHISSRAQAEYFTKLYNQASNEIKAAKMTADDAIEKFTRKTRDWEESISKTSRNNMSFYEALLREYADHEVQETGKKSIKLIEGTLSFRMPPPKFNKDEDTLRTYFETANPDFLEVVPKKVKWAEIKKAGEVGSDGIFRINGSEVPGVEVERQDVTFSIK